MRNKPHTAVRKCKITDLRSGVSVGKAIPDERRLSFGALLRTAHLVQDVLGICIPPSSKSTW